jgi:ribosomal protein S21
MVSVKRRSGESEEQLLKRFRKKVTKSRILTDARRKRCARRRQSRRR